MPEEVVIVVMVVVVAAALALALVVVVLLLFKNRYNLVVYSSVFKKCCRKL